MFTKLLEYLHNFFWNNESSINIINRKPWSFFDNKSAETTIFDIKSQAFTNGLALSLTYSILATILLIMTPAAPLICMHLLLTVAIIAAVTAISTLNFAACANSQQNSEDSLFDALQEHSPYKII